MNRELMKELQKEVPNGIFTNEVYYLLEKQNPRSKEGIYKALNLLVEKFPKKKITFWNAARAQVQVEPLMDRNCIKVIMVGAPVLNGEQFYQLGTTPDNQQEDGKIVHGKSAVMIDGRWLALTRNQRSTFVAVSDKAKEERFSAYLSNRIFAENPVELGFAIHNQVFIFSDIFDSVANTGEIFQYIMKKAVERMSFDFSDGLSPEVMSNYIYGLKTAGYRMEIEKIKSAISVSEAEQTKLLQNYSAIVRQNEVDHQKYAALVESQGSKENTLIRITKEIQSLIDDKKYMEFYIERHRDGSPIFCAVTNRVFLVFKDQVYDFGYYTVKIRIQNGSKIVMEDISFDNPEVNKQGYNHPHAAGPNAVDRASQICWGSAKADVAKMCGQGDIIKLLELCYFFLQSYSDVQPYIKIGNFGIVPEPMTNFKQRRDVASVEEYRKYKEGKTPSVVARQPDEPDEEEDDMDDDEVRQVAPDDLVCEGCGQNEEGCACDTEHPLIHRRNYGGA